MRLAERKARLIYEAMCDADAYLIGKEDEVVRWPQLTPVQREIMVLAVDNLIASGTL